MIGLRFRWFGKKNMTAEEFERLRPRAAKALLKAALHFESAVKKTLTGTRTGRLYYIARLGRMHRASAPGEPPATLTGRLRQSITHSEIQSDGENVWINVGTDVPYGKILEFGGVTSDGIRILPRPYMAATFLREEDRISKILEEATKS
jgi:Bacteriophage protein of unknown function (DUF646).